ncbi:MAG: amphi-Trp domain-containing protein, partial [Myxococcales bacterium FL481]
MAARRHRAHARPNVENHRWRSINPNHLRRAMQNEVNYKAHVEIAQAVAYLRELAQSLEDGVTYIKHESRVIALRPPEGVEFEIEAAEKKQKQKLNIELSWHRRAEQHDPKNGLQISATEPEPEPEP